MSFIDCILDHVENNRLDRAKAQQLLNHYEGLLKKYSQTGQGSGAAMKAAQDVIAQESRVAVQKARNLRGHVLKQKEIERLLDSKPGKIHQKVADIYQNASWRGEGVRATMYSFMDSVAEKIKGNFLGLDKDHSLFERGVRSALGESVDDTSATQIGKVIREAYDYAHSRYRAAGGVIGKKANYYPQTHTAQSIRKVDKSEWTNYVLDRVDREKMLDDSTGLPFTDKKLEETLGNVYDDIVTDGRASLQKQLDKGTVPRTGTPFEQRKSQARFIEFKSPDDFLEYNKRFGTGENGLMQSFLDSIDAYSRDIGVLEVMGPRPDSMHRFLSAKMKAEGTGPVSQSFVDSQYRVLKGLGGGGETDALWWKVLNGAQNWIRASALGSASISAISDTAFIASTAKVNGLSASRALGKYSRSLVGSSDLKQIARRSGFLVDVINGNTLSDTRFAGETMPGKFTSTLARATNKLSGLHLMTKAAQDSISLEFNATIAELVSSKKSWNSINPDLKQTLEKFNLNEKDWAELAGAKIEDNGSAKFLITNDLRVDSNFNPKRAMELANKLDDVVFSLRQMAANEAGLASRSLSTGAAFGDGTPGSLSRAFASSLFMFKTFPITVMLTHLLPSMRRAGIIAGNRGLKKYDHFAAVMVGATIMGSIPLMLKDLVKGKAIDDPEKYFSPRFFINAALQGGGLGLFGDFLFKDQSRYGSSMTSELLGPLASNVDNIYKATKGNYDKYINGQEPNFLKDTFKVAKRNIPVVGSLWYSRLVLERLMLDNMERLIDPKFDSKMHKLEQKMMKKQGTKFWWRP